MELERTLIPALLVSVFIGVASSYFGYLLLAPSLTCSSSILAGFIAYFAVAFSKEGDPADKLFYTLKTFLTATLLGTAVWYVAVFLDPQWSIPLGYFVNVITFYAWPEASTEM